MNSHLDKKVLVVSGINIFQGGPLSILNDCLSYLNSSKLLNDYTIIALVHKTNLFDSAKFNNIKFVEFPKSRQSYIYRLYYEYFYFKKFAKSLNVYFWLSLHDVSPNVGKINQAVYCHNASPFYEIRLKNIFVLPTYFFFTLLYKYLYKINIKKNKFIIVQQNWLKEKFVELYDLSPNRIIVAKPEVPIMSKINPNQVKDMESYNFFYPTYPRPYKNLEVICQAAHILINKGIIDFKIYLTIDGTENQYSKNIFFQYHNIKNIVFLGILKREEVYEMYQMANCLLFPSKLESWGLPITEFIQHDKPIIVSNLPYAKETVGTYGKVKYFNPSDANELADLMISFINKEIITYDITDNTTSSSAEICNWGQLFNKLLN